MCGHGDSLSPSETRIRQNERYYSDAYSAMGNGDAEICENSVHKSKGLGSVSCAQPRVGVKLGIGNFATALEFLDS